MSPKSLPSLNIPTMVAVLLPAAIVASCGSPNDSGVVTEFDTEATYAGSAACAGCHEEQYRAWRDSHHRMAMQPPSEETVVGDFSGSRFGYAGFDYEFYERDGAYYVVADDESGEAREFEIEYTFGIYPLQQYLVALPGGRLQALGVAWDARPAEAGGQRWFHLYPGDAITHTDELHWTGRQQNWNFMCADCHSTDFRKNYSRQTKSYQSTFAEVTVGCEACHGPGSVHVARADRGSYDADDLSRAVTDPAAQIEVCAKCHSRRGILAEGFEPGSSFHDHYRPALIEDGLYFADGQIQDEVYVYGSFLQSKMHQRGVVCSDCHDPHGGQLISSGNETCTTCHRTDPPDRFPTLSRSEYDDPRHHFHEPDSEGARCVSCHMPERLYMVVDARRDHSFRIPRPDLSASTGSPDVCTGCHAGRDAEWAAAELARRFPTGKAEHYGEVLAAARVNQNDAAARLAELASNGAHPPIVRGTALAELYGYADPVVVETLADGLGHADALIRQGAVQGMAGLDIEQRWSLAQHLLDDERLAIRSNAAVALAPMLERDLLQADRTRLQAAIADYVETQELNADRPEALTNIGNLYSMTGEVEAAQAAYADALQLDEDFVPALVNQADLHRRLGRETDAARLLEAARTVAPENAGVRHALGLSLVRQRRLPEAIEELAEAARLGTADSRYAYTLGIALNSVNRSEEAVNTLEAALDRFPGDAELLFALTTIERDRGNYERALHHLQELLERQPGNPQLLQLRRQLESVSMN